MSSAAAHLRQQSIAQCLNLTRADQRHTRHGTSYDCSNGEIDHHTHQHTRLHTLYHATWVRATEIAHIYSRLAHRR
jgi:hypothetical protein